MRKRQSCQRIIEHIERTDPWGATPRGAAAALPTDFCEYTWPAAPVTLAADDPRFKDVAPASQRDVKRYTALIKRGSQPPAIVLTDEGGRFAIHDGAHRLAAMRAAGGKTIAAYIGVRRRM